METRLYIVGFGRIGRIRRIKQIGQTSGLVKQLVPVAEHAVGVVRLQAVDLATVASVAAVTEAVHVEHALDGQKGHLLVAVVGVALPVHDAECVVFYDGLHFIRCLERAAVVEAPQTGVHGVALDVVRAEGDVAALPNRAGLLHRPVTATTDERLHFLHVAAVRVVAQLAQHPGLCLHGTLVAQGRVT